MRHLSLAHSFCRTYTRFERLFRFRDLKALFGRAPKRPRGAVSLSLEGMEDRLVPDGRPLPSPVLFAGAGLGAAPVVKEFNALTGEMTFQRTVYDPNFLGGVRVAAGDLNGDGFPDVVTAPGVGGSPHIRVLDGKTGDPIAGPLGNFWAFERSFTGGVNVAVADVTGHGYNDVIVAAGAGGGPRVRVFDGHTGAIVSDFFAFDPNFRGGATIAAADFLGTGKAQLAVGAGVGGGPVVRVFDALNGQPVSGPLSSFFAFDPTQRGGVNVGTSAIAGDVNGDGRPDLAVGTGPGAVGEVKVFSGKDGAVLRDLTPFGPGYRGGVTTSLAYINDDKYADIVAGTEVAIGSAPEVKVFSGATGQQLAAPMGDYHPFGPTILGGVNVAATNDPPTQDPYPGGVTMDGGELFQVPGTARTLVPGQTLIIDEPLRHWDPAVPGLVSYGPAPTGTVGFYLHDFGSSSNPYYPLGTTTLTSVNASTSNAHLQTTKLPLANGTYTVCITYSGDTNFHGLGSPTPYSIAGTVTIIHGVVDSGCGCVDPFATAAGDGGAGQAATGAGGVKVGSGTVQAERSDLASGGFGGALGVSASWTNSTTYTDGLSGSGWDLTGLPHLYQANGNSFIGLVSNGGTAHMFDYYAGAYHPLFATAGGLTLSGGQFVATDGVGDTFTFYSFSGAPTGRSGRLISMTDKAGNVTTVTSWDSAGRPLDIQRTAGSGSTAVTDSFLGTYGTSGGGAGLVATETERQQTGGGAWQTVRRAEYTYYAAGDAHGTAGQLKTAVVKDAGGSVLDTSYYRYYAGSGSGSGSGSPRPLQYAFGPDAYARLVAALGTGVDALTDTQVATYADTALGYDSAGRATSVVSAGAGCSVCSGGLGTYTYAYPTTTAATQFDPNVWQSKTVETLPDGNTNTYYTNPAGQLILKVYTDTTTSQSWDTYTRYDSAGRAVLTAAPSAVTGYSESLSDLIGYTGPGATYLSSSAGMITTTTYATATTATTGTAGDVAGFLSETDIQQGTGGTPIKQQSQTYLASPAGTFVPATSTQYRNTGGTGGETTTTTYTWQGSTAQPASVTTTLPTVTAGENGPGTATATTTVYDSFGHPIWQKDAGGFLSYTQYDTLTGAVVKQIADVNTAATGDFTGLPAGWTTPAGGGLELITTYQVDGLGRPTKVTDPAGNVTYTVYLDAQHETLTYPGWNAATGRPTGPTRVTRVDRTNNYTESFTMTAAPHLTGGAPDGTEAVTGLQSLTRSYRNAAGQSVTTNAYFNLGGLTYSTGAMGTAGTNFYQTQYAFDTNGRPNKTVSPQGTITRTVYDGQGRTVSEWVGTNDTPGTGYWSPTNNTSPSNMVDVADYQYDGGGVGDGNVTKATAHPGGGAADRVTQTWFDWRDRAVATKSGVSATETDGVHRPLVVTTYDNLGEVTQTQQYDGDGVTPSISGGVLSLPTGTAAALRAQAVTSYDELGRAYQTQVYSVNPSTGSVSTSALTSNTYFDTRGHVMARSAPGGLWTKAAYDGAGRTTTSYTTDGAGGTTYAAAGSVSSDHVLTQTEMTYDADGNVIETITRDRFNTATGTGALGTPTTGVNARVSYSASYYDAANRPVASVNVGTNGGTAWTRPGSVPTGSSTVLVASESYTADAVQTAQLTGSPTGGTFTITFGGQTTSAIAYNATAATVQTALQALSSVGSGNAVVTAGIRGGWQVRFAGTLAGTFQATLTASGAGLTGGTSPGVAVSVVSAGGDTGMVAAVTDPLGLVNRTYSDAMGRTTQTVQDFTDGGITSSSNKTTAYTYNAAGMTSLTAALAGGGVETTAYVYGVTTAGGSGINSNDVVGVTQWPDKTTGAASSSQQDTVTVNALGQTLTSTDRNGSVHTLTYDVLGRVTSDVVTTLGTGVDGAVRRITTAYDGQGNAYLITSYNAASGGSIVNQVQRAYNGLGQLTAEYQAVGGAVNTSTTPVVRYAYSEMASGANHSRLTSMTYPDGYVVNYTYGSGVDTSISRLTSLSDFSGTLESYKYLGLGTVVERDHSGSGVNLTYISPTSSTGDAGDVYVGLDRFGRVVDQNWYNPTTGTSTADLQYGYDADGNRLWRNDMVNTAFGELYTYDGLNQLSSFARGTLNDTKTAISGTASRTQSWGYDALGNWSSVTTNGTAQTRSANAQNQYTAVSGATTPTYDANGNMTTDETGKQFVYDAWNRLVAVKNSGGTTTLETFSYDGLNRRVTNTVGSTTTNRYYSTDWQVLEEQVGTRYTTRYVWSPVYVDAMLLRDTDTSGTGLTATGTGYQRLWPSTDANWDVTVLVNSSGVVVERDAYDPFGATTVMNASWSTISGSGYSWVYLYQGGRLDGVTGSYAFRRRDEDPAMGRWTTPDPIGFGGMASNFYTFVADSPLVQDDPSGLKPTALTIEESKEPILGLAGAFAWPVKFVLNDKAAGLGGYVIQHVVRDRVTYQGNMPVKNDVHDFYEAFRVAPGETSPETTIIKKEDKGNLPVKLQDTLNDLAKFGVEIYGIASNDVYVELPGCPTITTIKGDAIYVDNVTPGAMTWKRGGDSWAGTLPSISTSGNQAEIDKVLNAYKATNQGSITPWVQHNITATGISGKKTTISGKTP